ncbi:MAG: hypothetical protein KC502_19995 [Myxococcales bacterium]|nr:hypothetical protein [Myxococcales bacterium]
MGVARVFWLSCCVLLMAACGSDADGSADAGASDTSTSDAIGSDVGAAQMGPPRDVVVCTGKTHQLYTPLSNPTLELMPDDLWSQPAPDSLTGIRLHVTKDTPWVNGATEGLAQPNIDLSRLDGWGTTASMFIRFDGEIGPLANGEKASVENEGLQLWQLGDSPVRLPFEATTVDDGQTVLIAPMVPLKPKTTHLLVATTALKDSAGACMAPSETTHKLLERKVTEAPLKTRAIAIDQALTAANIALSDVSAVSVFTTQSIVEESEAVAKDIVTRTFKWSQKATCTTPKGKSYQRCEARFIGQDYRKEREVLPQPSAPLEHIVRIWLPKTGTGPFPVVIFGHGLTGAKDQGEPVAQLGCPLGVAVVAIDAVKHGKHPAGGFQGLAAVLGFFGIDVASMGFDFLAMRDNWRQSTYDKLQLVALMTQQPDIDGDGKPDLDADKLAYLGVSLGGIMGSELLALSGQVSAAVLSVPGGKVSSIVLSSKEFGPLITAFKPDGTTDGDVQRFFPVLQTLTERGDSANWAPYVMKDRLIGKKAPSVLLQMAIGDEIVPNIATRMLVRAMGVPVLGDVLQPVGIVGHEAKLPISGNQASKTATAGVFQFDRSRKKPGSTVKAASHGSVPASQEALTQDKAFIDSWLKGNVPEVIDPYVTLNTPKLGK